MNTVITAILPPGTAAAEAFGAASAEPVYPEEAEFVARAVAQRRQEFVTGRSLARRALEQLGYAPTILPGASREPLWPNGIVGSITHCAGYCAAALARADAILTIGIDAEPNIPLPDDVMPLLATESERAWIAGQPAGERCDRLLFSAKESVFKAWFPLTRRWLDFNAAQVRVDTVRQTFHASFVEERCSIPKMARDGVDGRYLIHAGLILTAVVLACATGDSWSQPERC